MRTTKPVRVEITVLEEAEKIAGSSYGATSRYVTEAVAEKNARTKPNSSRIKFGNASSKVKEIDRKANLVKRCLDIIQFFGEHSDSNKKEALDKLKNKDEETRILIDRVYDAGKKRAEEMKTELKELLDALENMEEKPKTKLEILQKEFWRIENEKIEKQCKRAEELYEKYLEKEESLEREELAKKAEKEHQAKLREDPKYDLKTSQIEHIQEYADTEGISFLEARRTLMLEA